MAEIRMNPVEQIESLPEWMKRFHSVGKPMRLEELLPGDKYARVRQDLSEKGWTEDVSGSQPMRLGAFVRDGFVVATAAVVSRETANSYDYLHDVKDFSTVTRNRNTYVPFLYTIYRNEGIINNAINKAAALIAADGHFYIKHARKGKRPRGRVREDLTRLLDWWTVNVNSNAPENAVTGARGLAAIQEQGSRQAMIEGSFLGYWSPEKVKVPSLDNGTFDLPMFIQSISTQYIEVPEELVGTGYERFFWRPPRQVINRLVNQKDPEIKRVIESSIDPDVLVALKKDGRALLKPDRLIHIKFRGVQTDAFGESYIEPALPDIMYKRALQALEFTTIDSLISRVVIIKVGSDDPNSDYHNLETSQARLGVLRNMFQNLESNMHVLWAGPDIDVIEVSAHDTLPDVKDRFDLALGRTILSLGAPKTLLDGTADSGQIWAAYEGYREMLRGTRDSWAQAFTQLGQRIAALNGFEDVELVYMPDRGLLADQNASADLMLRAHKAGIASLHRVVAALNGNFEAERRTKLLEMGLDPDSEDVPPDTEIFAPPRGMPGDTRTDVDGNVRDPGGEPGRPPDSEREDIAPERAPENRNPNDGA